MVVRVIVPAGPREPEMSLYTTICGNIKEVPNPYPEGSFMVMVVAVTSVVLKYSDIENTWQPAGKASITMLFGALVIEGAVPGPSTPVVKTWHSGYDTVRAAF